MDSKRSLLTKFLINISIYGLLNYLLFIEDMGIPQKLTLAVVLNSLAIYWLFPFATLLMPKYRYFNIGLNKRWIRHGILMGGLWSSTGHLFNINSSVRMNDPDIYHYYLLGIAHLLYGITEADQFIAIGLNKVKIKLEEVESISYDKILNLLLEGGKMSITYSDKTIEYDMSSFKEEKVQLIKSLIDNKLMANKEELI